MKTIKNLSLEEMSTINGGNAFSSMWDWLKSIFSSKSDTIKNLCVIGKEIERKRIIKEKRKINKIKKKVEKALGISKMNLHKGGVAFDVAFEN